MAHDRPNQDTEHSKYVNIQVNMFRVPKQLKHREIFNHPTVNPEELTNINPFMLARKIKHPRERMNQYMILHNKIYTNERLHRFRLMPSPTCATCPDTVENLQHVLNECPQANTAWKIFESVTGYQAHPTEPQLSNEEINLRSLVKMIICTNRDEPIKTALLETRLRNRISDLRIISWRKAKNR